MEGTCSFGILLGFERLFCLNKIPLDFVLAPALAVEAFRNIDRLVA